MSDMKPQGTQSYGVENGYERADADASSVLTAVFIIISTVFVCMAVVFVLYGFFNRQFNRRDAAFSAVATQHVVPPEPRLLPSPYTDTYKRAALVGRRTSQRTTTPDRNPWDKRNDEILGQYAEANSYGSNPDGTKSIPVAAAMTLEASGGSAYEASSAKAWSSSAYPSKSAAATPPTLAAGNAPVGTTTGGPVGTPAIMTWQPQYQAYVDGGKDGASTIGLGDKQVAVSTFDRRADWETDDEKFTAASASGTNLKAQGDTGMSR